MSITQRFVFSGHESFSCKSLWLKKGYDFVVNGKNFNNPEAVVELGVGKNMVTSIRYWLKVFGICENDKATELGHFLFDSKNGKDCYVEDLATLWLLHFNLVFLQEATLYNLFFCGFQKERSIFDREQLATYVKVKLTEKGKLNLYNQNTVKKDIGVLLSNYLLPLNPSSNEDYFSLLIDLDLIRQSSENNKSYYFNIDGKRKVIEEVFLYALIKLREKLGDNSIPFEVIYENIGVIFCLTDYETIELLKIIVNNYSEYISYSDVAGIRQVQFIGEIDGYQVLKNYYETRV
jgi:hypothetical protein